MKFISIIIRNFRGLANIETEFGERATVIVGPNAMGKTTFLEAIRLTRCLLAPRYVNEQSEMLTQIGALSPHTGLLDYSSLVSDTSSPLEVQLSISLNDHELRAAENNIPRLALLHVRDTLGVQPNQNDLSLIQYLSSPEGQKIFDESQQYAFEEMEKVKQSKVLNIHLLVDGSQQQIRGIHLFSQEVLRLLEEILPPSFTGISYFPADRAMPMGETNIQLGSVDSQQQLQSHLANPSLKYQRLKQFIINQNLISQETQQQLNDDFALIFESLLVGKVLKEFRITNYGLLSVQIEEKATGKSFDIDQMSSGEKGLVLQFLLLRRAIRKGGIALIDEPELHLNPAVSKQLLQFIIKNVSEYRDIQAIICTHSPEILADAFDNQQCLLLHLRSGNDISAVYPQDKAEVFEALRRLGASTSDVLFSRGSLFLEGPHDAEILETAFRHRVAGYKLTPLRGRKEIEKEIRTLQEAEKRGNLTTQQLFIFDRDREITSLENSPLVKFLQWDRYCLENYLLDSDAIYDVCQTIRLNYPPESRGQLRQLMKTTAFTQLKAVVARQVYEQIEPPNAGFRPSEIGKLEEFSAMAGLLVARMMEIKEHVNQINQEEWKHRFVEACGSKYGEMKLSWEENWQNECDGKKVLSQLHSRFETNISLVEFKRRIAARMAEAARTGDKPSDNWRIVDSLLASLIE